METRPATKSPPDSGGLDLGIAMVLMRSNQFARCVARGYYGQACNASSLWAVKRLAFFMACYCHAVN